MDNKVGTDGPTGLPAAQNLLPCPFCGGEVQFRKALWPSDGDFDAIIHRDSSPHCGVMYFSNATADGQIIDVWNRRAVAHDPSYNLAASLAAENRRLREALERGDDDRTTADWNLIDRWARAALVIIPSHDVWRTALLRIADEHKVYKGHGDHDTVPACSAEEAQSLARTALRNGEPG